MGDVKYVLDFNHICILASFLESRQVETREYIVMLPGLIRSDFKRKILN